MSLSIYHAIELVWSAVGVTWLVAALTSKRTARRQPAASRLMHIAIMIAAFALMFPRLPLLGVLGSVLDQRFVRDSPLAAWSGLALAAGGCTFAVWARLLLGRNWSGRVTLKQDHQLIRQGPYAIVRHPIYSGFLVGLLGTALALGEWRALAGWLLACIGWYTKSRTEDAFLAAHFGAAYTGYRRQVRALIPWPNHRS